MGTTMDQTVDRRGFVKWAAAAALAGGVAISVSAGGDFDGTRPRTDRERLLSWFISLRGRDERRLVSGQHLSVDVQSSYERLVESLARRSGKHIAMIGVDYAHVRRDVVNRVLIDQWSAGGLVTIDLHPANPWVAGGGWASTWVPDQQTRKPDLRQLLQDAPPSGARGRWLAGLHGVADGLSELREAGVVVLFRPLHELNGTWFWWGHDTRAGSTAVVELYRDLHDFLTRERGLDNLLWMYSPAPSFDAPVMRYYPGDAFIDVIAPTRYDDLLRFYGDRSGEVGHTDRADLTTTGKPMGWGECGPDATRDGSWDARIVVERIRSDYPEMVFSQCWHSWQGADVALADTAHAEEVLHDPWVITRDEVDWRG